MIFIFGLDYINRLDEVKERDQKSEETLLQLRALTLQAEAAKQQADFSLASLNLLKLQAQEQQLRELWRVLPILDDIQGQMQYWINIFDANRWNSVTKARKIMPVDSSVVLVQAARHSNELWNDVREMFQIITNSDHQIAQYYEQDQPAYRQTNLIAAAHDNLRNAQRRFTQIVSAFKSFEESERTRLASPQIRSEQRSR